MPVSKISTPVSFLVSVKILGKPICSDTSKDGPGQEHVRPMFI